MIGVWHALCRTGHAALAAAAVYGAILFALWWGQEGLLFHPQPLPQSHRFTLGADVHETWVDVPGARLHALHLRLPQPRGVVFFLHGNAGSLASWFVNPEYYRRANFDLFMIDYRGYGKSTGQIQGEAQLHADVRAAWASVAAQYAGRKVVIYGRSLGSGLAASLAAQVQPALTVLVSPYKSMVALAGEHYPWVPAVLLRYPLRTDVALAQVGGPVLLAHGARDALIPPDHSRALAHVAPQARLLILADADHDNIHQSPAYRAALRAVLAGR